MSQSMSQADNSKEQQIKDLRAAALHYHEFPVPGKIEIAATKQLTNQRDLALAYTPGVAAACEEIVSTVKDELPIWKYQVFADGTSEWVNSA